MIVRSRATLSSLSLAVRPNTPTTAAQYFLWSKIRKSTASVPSRLRSVPHATSRSYSTSRNKSSTSESHDSTSDSSLQSKVSPLETAESLSSAFIAASTRPSQPGSSSIPNEPEPASDLIEQQQATQSASEFLRHQAELEEAREAEQEQARKKLTAKVDGETAWDGDETRDRMIRRILEDQYKPLRIKGFKKAIPGAPTVPHPSVFSPTSEASDSRIIPTRSEPLPEKPKPLYPWDYEYKAPASHGTSNTHPNAPRSSLLIRSGPSKVSKSQRIASAREKTLDYGFGVGVLGPSGSGRTRVMVPTSDELEAPSGVAGGATMRAWDGFVEDKVHQAIQAGLFKNLSGRGKPLQQDEAARNPFLPREDRLINRVVKGQGAMPPWVEMQQELELNLSAFRNELRSAYTRRLTRTLSLPGNLSRHSISLVLLDEYRDQEWEERERSYHQASIASLNALTRRLNIVAPYTARRGLLKLERELEACRRYCAPWIAEELVKRIEGKSEMVDTSGNKIKAVKRGDGVAEVDELPEVKERFWPALRRGVWELLGIGPTAEKKVKV